MISLSWQGIDGQLRTVELDAYDSEGHEDIVTITDHPVETGVVVTDHAKDEPKSVNISGLVSNVPMRGKDGIDSGLIDLSYEYMQRGELKTIELNVARGPITPSVGGLIRAGVGALSTAVFGGPRATVWGDAKRKRESVRATVLRYGAPQNRPQAVDLLLQEAIALKARITITTPLRTVNDLLIARLYPSRTVQSGRAVLFQIDLRQIRVVNSETVEAPIPTEARGATRKHAGAQTTTSKDEESDDKAEKYESTLSVLF